MSGDEVGRKSVKKRDRLKSIATRDGLRIVIATTPTSHATGVELAYDLQLIRSALLYADQVEIISPGVTMLESMRQLHRAGPDALIALATSLDAETLAHLGGGNPAQIQLLLQRISEYQSLNRAQKRNLPADARLLYETMLDQLRASIAGADQTGLERHATNVQMLEIDEALDSGLLKINHDVTQQMFVEDSFGETYGEILRDLIAGGGSLLLDDQVGKVVRAMIREGMVEMSQVAEARSIKASAGTTMIAQLPAFHRAEVGKILEVRSDLDQQLSRYRRGMREYAQKLESYPFTPELQDELHDMWLEEIQPAVQDIQTKVSRKTIAKNTAWEAAASTKFFGIEGAASLLHFQGPSLGMEAVAATAAAATTAIGGLAGPFVNALRQAQEAKEHDLFYLASLENDL